MSPLYQDYDHLTGGLDENQFSGESYSGGDEEDDVHGTGSQDVNGFGESFDDSSDEEDDNEDIDLVAQVDPRCYNFLITDLDSGEPGGDSPSVEEIERRYNAFFPQWNEMSWQAPVRRPLSPSLSPRTSIQPSRSRASSVISISSDESESGGPGVLDDLGSEDSESNSSVEFLGVSPVISINDTDQYRNATPKNATKHEENAHHSAPTQNLQDQKGIDLGKFEYMSTLVDPVEEPTRENVCSRCNKRKRKNSVEFLFEFQRNVRPMRR